MKKIIKLILCLGLIPFLCSLTKEEKFIILSHIVYCCDIPIQNLQCRGYDLETLEFFCDNMGNWLLPDYFIEENDRYVGLNPKTDSTFICAHVKAYRQDTIFDGCIFFKGPKYYVVLNPSYVRKGTEEYTIGDMGLSGSLHQCDSCVTVYLDETVPFRTDTCTSMPTPEQTHVLSKRTFLRFCESDMYEEMVPNFFPTIECGPLEVLEEDHAKEYDYERIIEEIRRRDARYVLSYFDNQKVDKVLYSISDSLFYVILNTVDKDEYIVQKSGKVLKVKKTSLYDYSGKKLKRMRKLYEEAQPIFDPSRYIHGTVNWLPSDKNTIGYPAQRNYFQYVNAENKLILEYNVVEMDDNCQFLNPKLSAYLYKRLYDEAVEKSGNRETKK